SSNMNKRNDALPEEILTLLVYKAAEIEGREFLEMVFSTSVGRVLFNHYRNNLTLPEDVARANGHTILGDFLEDVNERLSKEVCRGDNYETIDWLELKYAVDKKICLPSTNDAQAVSSPVDDVNQSGYEADDEASSLPSPADTNANGSEMHDSEHGDIEQITSVPAEILAQGPVAKRLYEEALKDGSLSVYRTRILITGQDRAGKTSLKKSLLGQPFDPEEQSTDGIEVDPSKCAIKVDQIKNWNSTGKKESCLSECCEEISRMLAEKRYQWILQKEQMESEEVPHEEPKEKPAEDSNIKDENEILRTEDSPKSPNVYSSTSEKQDNETENQTRGCLEEKRSDCSSESGLIPDTVVEHADRLLKEMIDGKDRQNPQDDKESIVTIDLWDFAGQHLYYAAHSVFFTKRAVYILVHNLSKELNDPAQPCARQGCHNIILENPGRITNLEDLLSWLATIHSIKPKDEGMPVDNSGTGISYLRPPVFIVGTHADQPTENIEIVTTKIQQAISGKEYDKHVIRPFFSIDNTQGHQSSFGKTQRNESVLPKVKRLFVGKSQRSHQRGKSGEKGKATGDEIHILRAKIMEILRQEPYMGEKIPVRWFNFEKLVETLVASNVYFMVVEELRTLVENANIIEGDDHFKTMLNFYHDLGMIVKHRNTVILKAQWLIDLFRKLITIPTFDKMDPVESKHWPELERNGVLSMELVDHVFTKFLRRGVIKEDILDMMEQFGLIAKFSSPALPDVKYFVPCQLKSPPIELCKMEPSSTDPCPLYLYFLDGFVPHGLFPRLVSSSTAWVATTGSSHLPKLYQNGAWFVLEGKVIHDMILICKKRFIKILLREVKEAKAVALPLSTSRSAEVARRVRLFLKSSLEHFSQEFPYLSKLRYQFSVECPYCLQRVEECAIHRKPSCTHEDCLHLLEVKQGKHLICMESAGYNEVLTVQGRDLWFSSEGTQDPSKTGSLRVTLLASEWGSSMGGMSTINRQLAILLAKHREIEVTLLVPKFSCSEEDRRTAWNHNVLIKEAEKRPGFDPLDWLSFPPKDLIIDVILGHGAQLGKQAQVIRESHNCQWVQVVHTAPEELGMFKTHPRAVAKGELKTTTEVDLCKLANLVVAIGPKLAEAYSAYLRPCQKQQDILKLTPGTFKEFSALIQDPVDLGNFRVLTFGRGDPEDFSLKGYDIAAKAVVELNDYSYHLIYVGAPDGKQEAVKERLLQSGISNRQLTVRTFLQDKEKLKECFCEVDLCIMPSRTEGFGLTGLEALSAGLPILVSGNSGFGDALCSVPSGRSFVVDSDDPKVWAEAIAGIRVKERLERLQETQLLRTHYEEQFSWEKQCDRLVDKMWNKVYGAGMSMIINNVFL
ncbi:D-inositol 3-phosphate glycosyltransferase, partial [Stylophora pistillata]